MDTEAMTPEERSKAVALIRKAMAPLLKDYFAEEFRNEVSYPFAREVLDEMQKMLAKSSDNTTALVKVGQALEHINQMAKRETTVNVPELATLTEKLDAAIKEMGDIAKRQVPAEATDKTDIVPVVKLDPKDLETLKGMGNTSIIGGGSKFPFTIGGQNVAMPLVASTASPNVNALPVVNPDGTNISGGSGGGGDVNLHDQSGNPYTTLNPLPVTTNTTAAETLARVVNPVTIASGVQVTVTNQPTVTVAGESLSRIVNPVTIASGVVTTTSGLVSLTIARSVQNGRTALAASGIALQLTPTPIKQLVVSALAANQGIVKIGNSSGQSFELQAGQSSGIEIDDAGKVYFVGDFVGDGVCWIGS